MPNGPIKSADLIQYFNLLTGAMVDQPVTFANTLAVGGSQGVGSAPFKVAGVAAQTANMAELRTLAADVQPVFKIDKTGTVSWGPGGGTGTDVTLSRSGANQLTLTGLAGTPALIIPVGGVQVTAGNIGVGVAPGSGAGIYVLPTISAGSLDGVYSAPITAAIAFTAASVAGFHAATPTKGAGSTITNAYGLLVDAITSAGTNNYGVYINTPSGGATANIGLRVTGGTPAILIDAGGLTVTAGTVILGAAAAVSVTGVLRLPASGGALTAAVGWRNNAGTGDLSILFDATDRLFVTGAIAIAATATAGGFASPGAFAGFIPFNYGGAAVKIPVFNP